MLIKFLDSHSCWYHHSYSIHDISTSPYIYFSYIQWGCALGAIAMPSSTTKKLPFLKQHLRIKMFFCLGLIFTKVFYMWINNAPVLALYCLKPCCKSSFDGFLPSALPYWNEHILLIYVIIMLIHMLFLVFSCAKHWSVLVGQ